MPQLQAVGVAVHLPDGSHFLHVEFASAIGLGRISGQLRGGKVVQIGVHHIDRPLLVGHVPHGVQGVVGQLGQHLRRHETAVNGKPLFDGFRRGTPVPLISGTHIIHTLLTTLIRLLKNTSRISDS